MNVQTGQKRRMKSSTARKEESVRDLIIPIHNPKIYPVIWRKDDLRRVKTASVVVSKEQRQQQIEKFEADRKRLELESEKRKQFLKDIDKIREEKRVKRVKEINDSGEDPKQILEKAFLARQEEVSTFYNTKTKHLMLKTKFISNRFRLFLF